MNGARGARSAALVAALAYLAISVWMTWPLAAAPARLGLRNMDVFGNLWAMAWSWHQVLSLIHI